MPQPLPNLRSALCCCAARLSQSVRPSRPPVHVRLSPGCARAPGCVASRSAIVRPYAAFFGLPGLAHRRFIALKAGILIQDGVAGITERFLIDNLLVVGLACRGL